MTAVYVDTSALLALLDQDDEDHAAVVTELRRLAEAGASLVTASYTLVETGALVRNRLGMAAFQALGQTVDRGLEVVWVDEELHRHAWRQAAAEPRRGASLVDWVGFVVMRNLGIGQALALDSDFRRQGFVTLPETKTSS
ncbi:MAG: PIN domain-containing protein [bacterium]|nr:PIN domain-containing protein [bacterium]